MPGEKTEAATPKRKEDERKKGNIFFSRELVTVATLLAVFTVIQIMMPFILTTLQEGIKGFIDLASDINHLSLDNMRGYLLDLIIMFVSTAMIPLLTCGLVAIISTMLQTRMLVSFKSMEFKPERINPIEGFKKMFSIRGVVELLKSLLKVAILVIVVYNIVNTEVFLLPRMMDMGFEAVMGQAGAIIMNIVLSAGAIFIFLGAADYLYQWWQYEKNLRMSKQEVKDEYKQIEGDPQVKSRMRSLQQQRARRRMMQEVPSADVVIRNPTHYAVALKYDKDKTRAPLVIAKGMDSLALRIIEIAEQSGVHITENKPLARALYESVDLNTQIPERFYRPVAEVLAFVFNLKKKDKKA